jgi:flavin reductase (DIM6/NTAB) family NADH-FMN oxidoreductase RutF
MKGRPIMGPEPVFRELLKRVLFGAQNFPQQCPVGMVDPQSEIVVRLNGIGEPLDVTHRHMMACGFPFTIGIGCEPDVAARVQESNSLSLAFHERGGGRRLLGKIGLRHNARIAAGGKMLCLLQPKSYANYCLPRPWLWSRYLYYARSRSGSHTAEMPLTWREVNSMSVFYICPRPVVLATLCEGYGGNMFPVNLMGSIDEDYFVFALNASRKATGLVERSRRIALSTVPLDQSPLALALGKNHRVDHISWDDLPFTMKKSTLLGIPVPPFAMRVREMQVESIWEIGSHKLFVARILHDDRSRDGLEFFVIHGIYQAYRQRAQHSFGIVESPVVHHR